jgi:hypothetical protein
LNEESCAVVLICWRTWLNCATRLARVACEFGSCTGSAAAVTVPKAPEPPVAEPLTAPTVTEAALLVVVMVIAPLSSIVACRLLAARAALSWLRVET